MRSCDCAIKNYPSNQFGNLLDLEYIPLYRICHIIPVVCPVKYFSVFTRNLILNEKWCDVHSKCPEIHLLHICYRKETKIICQCIGPISASVHKHQNTPQCILAVNLHALYMCWLLCTTWLWGNLNRDTATRAVLFISENSLLLAT